MDFRDVGDYVFRCICMLLLFLLMWTVFGSLGNPESEVRMSMCIRSEQASAKQQKHVSFGRFPEGVAQ